MPLQQIEPVDETAATLYDFSRPTDEVQLRDLRTINWSNKRNSPRDVVQTGAGFVVRAMRCVWPATASVGSRHARYGIKSPRSGGTTAAAAAVVAAAAGAAQAVASAIRADAAIVSRFNATFEEVTSSNQNAVVY
jgi:hypothetical protein